MDCGLGSSDGDSDGGEGRFLTADRVHFSVAGGRAREMDSLFEGEREGDGMMRCLDGQGIQFPSCPVGEDLPRACDGMDS